ncbi:MAG: hypothetical protein E7321_06530 [Clostridiales bacterium]|nr:hypothetical protein [Clostridiales bacterium]
MDKKQIDMLHQEIGILIDVPLNSVTRSADSLCLGMGNLIKCQGAIRDEQGKLVTAEVERSMLALEISCCYRIVCGNEILLAKSDLYQPAHAVQEQWALESIEEIPEDFDCEAIGNNRLDDRIKQLFSDCKDIRVSAIKVNQFGDLKLSLSNGLILSSTSDVSGEEECWRFFRRDTNQHIVVTGVGLEIDEVDDSLT